MSVQIKGRKNVSTYSINLAKLHIFVGNNFALSVLSCSLDIGPEESKNTVQCELLDSLTIVLSNNPTIGNWDWIKRKPAFGGIITPDTEGYQECWIIDQNTITICRDGFIDYTFQSQIHYDAHPYAGNPNFPDSTYLFYSNTVIISFLGDTMEIYDSYVDGNDCWLIKK